MSVLILHRNPFEPFPFGRWLHDYPGEIVVLASRDKLAPFGEEVPTGNHGFTHLELLDDFEDEGLVRARALKLADEYGARHVVAHHEGDIILAAWLRECLGLDGATWSRRASTSPPTWCRRTSRRSSPSPRSTGSRWC
jgi:hypothetical protein